MYGGDKASYFVIVRHETKTLAGGEVKKTLLEPRDMNYVNGKIAQFMDAYIRQHKVWTPDQMLESFVEKQLRSITNLEFRKDYESGTEIWSSELSDRWLISDEGQVLAHERMAKKYGKDKPIAVANSPIVERVRFGLHWNKSKYFDISFGLKGGHGFVDTEELKKYPYRPWTIRHVDQQLNDLFHISLPDVFQMLCTSPLEASFYEYWLKNYYGVKEGPALLPEVCGFRAKFWYLEYKGLAYPSYGDLPHVDDLANIRAKNFRFDFFVSNTSRNRAALIELDGHDHHKTKPQRIIDSIKRNEAARLDIPVIVFTGTQLHSNIAACFSSINDFLTI